MNYKLEKGKVLPMNVCRSPWVLNLTMCLAAMLMTVTSAWARDDKYWDNYESDYVYSNFSKETDSSGKTVFLINNAAELGRLAHFLTVSKDKNIINEVQNGIIRLENDIDLADHRWRALGEGSNGFFYKGTFDGNGKVIRNMYINEGNGGKGAGFFDKAGNGMTVKNVIFENCYATQSENTGLVVGLVENANDVTFENIEFRKCRVWCDEHNGFLTGYVNKSKNLKVKDITIHGKYEGEYKSKSNDKYTNVEGSNYNGGLIGWLRQSDDFEFDHVFISDVLIRGTHYVGGIVGEINASTGIIKNCYTDTSFSGGRDCTGGIAGKIYNNGANVTIKNCVIRVKNDIFLNGTDKRENAATGGAVGLVSNQAYLTLDNVAVRLEKSEPSFQFDKEQGLLVGSSSSKGHIEAKNCYYDTRMGGKTTSDVENLLFGTNITSGNRTYLQLENLCSFAPSKNNAEDVYFLANMNALGACYGYISSYDDRPDISDYFFPLKDKESGMVVGYTYSKNTGNISSAKGGDPQSSNVDKNNIEILGKDFSIYPIGLMVMMKYGKPTTYTFVGKDGKWIYRDASTNVKDKKRINYNTFVSWPESHGGMLKAEYIDKPKIKGLKADYNDVKKTVKLTWTVDKLNKDYWKDAKYVIERKHDSKSVYDTINVDHSEWTDYDPMLTGKNSIYSVYVICPSLFYSISDNGSSYSARQTVTAKEGYTISGEGYRVDGDMVYVHAKIPNSQLLKDANIKLLKWTSNTEDEYENAHNGDKTGFISNIINNAKDYTVKTLTYKPNVNNDENYLQVELSDDVDRSICYMTYYMIYVDGCKNAGTLKDKTYNSKKIGVAANESIKIYSFMASKGEMKVNLSWKVKNNSEQDMIFSISRKRYVEGDTDEKESDWLRLANIQSAASSLSYTDDAYPGYVYVYRIRAHAKCSSTYSEAVYESEAKDIGFTTSRGTIMGTITYNGGSNIVQGVDVRLASDGNTLQETIPAYSMFFSGEKDCLPLAPGLGDDFWAGDWTLQFLMRPHDTQSNSNNIRVLSLPGRMAVNLNQQSNTLLLAGNKMAIKDGSWDNHIVIQHDNSGYKLGITSAKVDGGVQTDWLVKVTDKAMIDWMKNNGEEMVNIDTLYFGLNERQLTKTTGIPASFKGWIDEVKLWNDVLTSEELENTYDRYIAGTETKLRGYYTFDSGVGEYAFDGSHPGGVWGNRNTKLPLPDYPSITTFVPDDSVLCYRGITDKYGNYQIAGVPYMGEGTNYMVVPVYGTHEFQPASIRRFVSANSLAHSDVDFTDKSSFYVKVKARYAMGNYPVKGLNIYVDGISSTSNGKEITTDENGEAEIQVPIGQHQLKLLGTGHTLVNEGYPCSVTGIAADGTISYKPLQETDQPNYLDFQHDRTAPVEFYDGTFARLAGKIVGGSAEEEKPIGFGLTNANLGNARIVIKPEKDADKYALYSFGAEGDKFELGNSLVNDTLDNGQIKSVTTYTSGSSEIAIDVDPVSGEYLAMVPPINMMVDHVCTTGTAGIQLVNADFRYSNMPNTIKFEDITQLKADTLWVEGKDSSLTNFEVFKYHAKKSYINYVDPEFSLYNPNAKDSLMQGDPNYTTLWQNDLGETVNDTVPLWHDVIRDGSSDSYLIKTTDSQEKLIGRPVFTQGYRYKTYMRIAEKYTNRTTGRDSLYNQEDILITIHNALSTKGCSSISTGGYSLDESKAEDTELTVSEDGIVKYDWIAGYPNPTGDHTLSMQITYTTNGVEYSPETGKITGIVAGAVPIPGTNFVTAGPNMVSFVLRDPPGSGSYSWLEKGSTITSSYTQEKGWLGNNDYNNSVSIGHENITFAGDGMTFYTGTNIYNYDDVNWAIVTTQNIGDNKSHSLSFTLNDNLQTSSDPYYVGVNGDIYVGTSSNMNFAQCNVLGFRRLSSPEEGSIMSSEKNHYVLDQDKSIAQTDSFTTVFVYSQEHIINELIPQLKSLRHSRIDVWTDGDPSSYNPDPDRNLKRAFYVARKSLKMDNPIDEADIWDMDKDYVCFMPTDTMVSTADTINIYNQWIDHWYKSIEENEKTKYETQNLYNTRLTQTEDGIQNEYGYMGNTSVDAGVTYTHSITRNYDRTVGDYQEHSEQLKISFAFEHAIKIGAAERMRHQVNIQNGLTYKSSEISGKSITQTFGYCLDDTKSGNFFSVDTYLPGVLTGQGSYQDLYKKSDAPKFDEFFVFRVRGGQSSCPYLPAEKALRYKKDGELVTLNDGTIPIEDPQIEFVDKDIHGIASGESCYTQIKLSNKSAAVVRLPSIFDLVIEENTNPNGLQLIMDGTPIGSNTANQIYLMPGESITKTLEIKQTDARILDYDNIVLSLYSDCEMITYASDSIRVSFKAASSPIDLVQMDNVVNTVNSQDTSVVFRIQGYDIDRDGFAGVRLKYKKENELEYKTGKILVNDTTLYEQNVGKIDWNDPTYMHLMKKQVNSKYVTEVKFPMGDMDDGKYLFLAEAFTPYSRAEEAVTLSDTLRVLKDTKRPEQFLAPSPASGYYTIGSEISLQMNEEMQMENVSSENFSVTTALNDAIVTHNSGLHFNGLSPAHTTSRVQILDSSTGFGFWYKPVVGKTSCLLSQTVETKEGAIKAFKIMYNSDATLSIILGDKELKSERHAYLTGTTTPIDDWMYLAMTSEEYADEPGNGCIILYNLFGTSNVASSTFIRKDNMQPLLKNANVPLYLGGSEQGDSCFANIEGLVVYDETPSFEFIAAEKDNKHTNNTRGLLAYYPMDESRGLWAHDLVRSRDLKLMGTDNWYLPVTNYALRLNGKDEYVNINTSACPIDKNEDYLLEFWFNSQAGKLSADKEMTLFSNGLGYGDDSEPRQNDHASLSLGSEGQIILRAAGNIREMGSGYDDGQWHHLAMNVQRDSYVTLMVDTIDISSSTTLAGSDFGSFANSGMTLGALRYDSDNGNGNHVTILKNFFNGQLDEVRLWRAYRTNDAAKKNAFTRLIGTEPGLVAYYPFEETEIVAGQIQTKPYLGDRTVSDPINGITTAAYPTIAPYDQDHYHWEQDTVLWDSPLAKPDSAWVVQNMTTKMGPQLSAAEIITSIDINFTTNQKDKIVLSFPDALKKARIEGCVVNFQVKGLKDKSGNPMKQPINWSVYVHQNPLSWTVTSNILKQNIGESTEAVITISNKSSVAQSWSINTVPTWIDLSETTGILGPFSSTTVKLTTESGTPIGSHQSVLYLVGNDEIYTPMDITLSVTSPHPNWAVADTDGSIWMTIMGRVKINENWDRNEDDLVGMFTEDGRCLALASPTYDKDLDTYFLHLNVKGNSKDSGKKLKFRVWDSSTGIFYEDANVEYYIGKTKYSDSIQIFQNMAVMGDFTRPYVVMAGQKIRQTLALHEGWNWVSLWVKPQRGSTAKDLFGTPDCITEIKASEEASYAKNFDSLTLYPSNMYRIYLKQDTVFTIEGAMEDPNLIGIHFYSPASEDNISWTWLGFPLWKMMTLSEAFADFKPLTNDIIKSENQYAMYNGKKWVGDLKYLTPGMGYIYGYHYNNQKDQDWKYPNRIVSKNNADSPFVQDVMPCWYEDYTFVDISVVGDDNSLVSGYEYRLAAFTEDGICHGVADGKSGESCPISIFGDDGEVYTFKMWNKANNKVYDLDGTKEYDNLTSPQSLTLHLPTTTGIDTEDAADGDSWYTLGGIKKGSLRHANRGIYVKQNKKQVNK